MKAESFGLFCSVLLSLVGAFWWTFICDAEIFLLYAHSMYPSTCFCPRPQCPWPSSLFSFRPLIGWPGHWPLPGVVSPRVICSSTQSRSSGLLLADFPSPLSFKATSECDCCPFSAGTSKLPMCKSNSGFYFLSRLCKTSHLTTVLLHVWWVTQGPGLPAHAVCLCPLILLSLDPVSTTSIFWKTVAELVWLFWFDRSNLYAVTLSMWGSPTEPSSWWGQFVVTWSFWIKCVSSTSRAVSWKACNSLLRSARPCSQISGTCFSHWVLPWAPNYVFSPLILLSP